MARPSPFFYSVFGLTLKSNAPFPLLPASARGTHDVEVDLAGEADLGEVPAGAVVNLDGAAVVVDADGGRVVRYTDARSGEAVQLHFAGDGSRVRVVWTAGRAAEEVPAAVMAPLLGTCIRLRGVVLLHAGAVVVDGGAVLLLGAPGAGKSTTTAALMRRGHRVLTEEVVALDPREGGVWVQPGPGHIRLLPDAALALGETLSGGPPPSGGAPSGEEKGIFRPVSGGLLQSEPARATTLCFLERSREGARLPSLVPLPIREAVPRLLGSLFIRGRPDRELAGRAFRTCADLAKTCRSYAVRGALRLEDLGELADLVAGAAKRAPPGEDASRGG